ncbi:hypothetical protein, partial [Roseibium sp. RKSG952]|uniref:hypothetical protein n=1 Tax=Roseibium sp. RKSG952 TaxID=2529384 RepID=UPI0018AD1696
PVLQDGEDVKNPYAIDIDEDHEIYKAFYKAIFDAIEEIGMEKFKQCSFFPSSDYHKPGGRGHMIVQRVERCRQNKQIAGVAQG